MLLSVRPHVDHRHGNRRCVARAFLLLLACAFCGGGLGLADDLPSLATRTRGADWPSFLGPTHDSKSSETGLRADWSAHPPRVVWQRPLATSYGPPAVAGGRLVTCERTDEKATVNCYHAETGAPLWNFDYPTDYEDQYGYDNGPRSGPVIDGDRVYALGAEGLLHCLRLADGHLVWKVDTQARFGVVQNFFGVGCAPVIEGDLLIVPVGGSPPDSARIAFGNLSGNGSGVVAFDKLTGQVRYQLSDELAGYASPVPAEIDGRRWCFVFARGGLLAFDPTNGKLDFHFPWRASILESVNASNPLVVGRQVLISETYGPGSALLSVRPGGYDLVWADDPQSREKRLQTHWNTPIHHQGYVYASSGRHSNNAELRCIELATGQVMWSQPGLARCSLMYVDGHFVCLSEYGELILLRANPQRFEAVGSLVPVDTEPQSAQAANTAASRAGAERKLLEYPAWAAPILSRGLLYVRGRDRLVCLELIPETNN